MIWIIIALYLSGFYALHCISNDLSQGATRSVKSWLGLTLWPLVGAFGAAADFMDWVIAKKERSR